MKKYNNILLVEDGEYKSLRVTEFINENYPQCNLTIQKSYSSALNSIVKGAYDLIILDMSLPTFDKNTGVNSGIFRTYGGLDLARQIKRRKISVKFLFLTQYESFTDSNVNTDINEIDTLAKREYEGIYLGYIHYEHSGYKWKDELGKVLDKND